MPDGWMTTRAWAAVTSRTIDSGPDTVAVVADRTGSRISSPGGTSPRSTWTGTVFVTSGSSWTRMDDGLKSTIVTRGSIALTSTLTMTDGLPGWGCACDRSTVAPKLALVRCSATSAGAK